MCEVCGVCVSVCLVLLPDVDLCRPHTVLWETDEESNTPLLQSDKLNSSSLVFFLCLPLSENTPVLSLYIITHTHHTKYTIHHAFIIFIFIKY